MSEELRIMSEELKSCPFCGCNLGDFPEVMTVKPVHSEEYLMSLLNRGQFLGSDKGYNVVCERCGSIGARGITKDAAIDAWNRRAP